jgi:hypothetical protein
MKRKTSVLLCVLATTAILFPASLRAQDQPRYTPLEVESIEFSHVDDPMLHYRFNEFRPFAISINQKIPNASAIQDGMVQSIGQKGFLDILVFEWFGVTKPQTVELAIGENVPVEISQSVLRTFSREKELPLIISLKSRDAEMGYTQRIVVGSLVKSGKRPISPGKLDALLRERISREDFVKIVEALE